MKKINLTAFLFFALLAVVSCQENGKGTAAGITWLTGDVEITRDNSKFMAELNTAVLPNDLIKTGEKSFAAIQVGENLLLKISENSEIVFENLTDPGTKTLSLAKGAVMSKVKKLLKNDVYEIKTPTALAAVRGTTFTVSYDELGEKILIVAVSEGKVEVTHLKTQKSLLVPETKTVIINPDDSEPVMRDITGSEDLRNKSLDVIPFAETNGKGFPKGIENQSEISMKTAETDKKYEQLRNDEKFVMPRTLLEIKNRYGRVDQVVLYNGKVIKGIILNRGKTKWQILVPGKYTYVDAKDVERTSKIM